MENLNVILSLLVFLGIGSSVIHYTGSRKARARARAFAQGTQAQNAQKDY